MAWNMRALLAEFMGSAGLLAVVAGSGLMADKLAGGNIGLALLANSLATGAGLFVLIMLFAPLSGAHFNPAVSLMAALRGDLKWPMFVPFCLVQVAGTVAGVMLAHAMFDLPLLQTAIKVRSGLHLHIAEVVATCGLVLVIQGLRQQALSTVAASVALYIVAAYWFTASTSFANPAVTLARSLTDSFTGIRLQDCGGFILAQIVGAVLGTAIGSLLFAKEAQA